MKIAICGSAPSSAGLAPFADPSWTIWACSPAAVQFIKRSDVWFELHPFIPGQPGVFEPFYCEFLAAHPCVQMLEPVSQIPNSAAYPKDEMLAKFGPYFFTSSISWMMAKAIAELEKSGDAEKVIGLFGVDMQGKDEYLDQRAGAHYFICEASRRGIQVIAPNESDILRPSPLYGFCEIDPKWVKHYQREMELKSRAAQAEKEARLKEAEAAFLRGALDNQAYHRRTWG